MQLEFRHGDTVVRVDGDVVEIFGQGFSHRYLLPSLRVEVQPGSSKGTLVVRSASAPADLAAVRVVREGQVPARLGRGGHPGGG